MTLRLYRAAISLLVALLLIGHTAASARAQSGALYFPATGHHLTDNQGLLSFWRAHDGERLLGFPITEATTADGITMQYFERGRLEQQTDAGTGANVIRTGAVGAEYAKALWRRFAPAPPYNAASSEARFESTGHTLREPFLSFWRSGGGLEFFGAPISEAIWEMTARGQQEVQYFERARLERDSGMAGTPEELRVGDLGRALALLRGVDIAPIDNWGAETYGPPAPVAPDQDVLQGPLPPKPAPVPTTAAAPAAEPTARPAPQPKPAPQPRGSGGSKTIVVNLSDQWLYAFEGKQQVFDAPVSTGRDGMETPTGSFSIYAKLKVQTMDGITNGVPWVVPHVPNVMYINGGVALLGTYWHHRFGTGARLSHGCINLPLDAAAWLYDWAPMGTPVRVTY
jgi:lipoprotein-anchoring transpeptidase ErfK/SrfK